ncbi:MAG: SpoVT-AbrB protein [Candidatus Levybacteria bacterium]|nr:SpoVT-AbrB protein [Candidatus Levybacteria bacterium]
MQSQYMIFEDATVTSKLQLTIPVRIAREVGIKSGEKVQVLEENGRITITPMRKIIMELAGSLSLPEKWKGKNVDSIINEAKYKYFRKKR